MLTTNYYYNYHNGCGNWPDGGVRRHCSSHFNRARYSEGATKCKRKWKGIVSEKDNRRCKLSSSIRIFYRGSSKNAVAEADITNLK